jgi:hypothetical protein
MQESRDWFVRISHEPRMGTIVYVLEKRTGFARVGIATGAGEAEAVIERCKRSILERLSELGLLDAPDDGGQRGG